MVNVYPAKYTETRTLFLLLRTVVVTRKKKIATFYNWKMIAAARQFCFRQPQQQQLHYIIIIASEKGNRNEERKQGRTQHNATATVLSLSRLFLFFAIKRKPFPFQPWNGKLMIHGQDSLHLNTNSGLRSHSFLRLLCCIHQLKYVMLFDILKFAEFCPSSSLQLHPPAAREQLFLTPSHFRKKKHTLKKTKLHQQINHAVLRVWRSWG